MDEQTIMRVASTAGWSVKRRSRGFVHVTCPYAPVKHAKGTDGDPSMGIEIKPGGISRWRCLTCSEGGDMTSVLYELQTLGLDPPMAELMPVAVAEEDTIGFPSLYFEDKEEIEVSQVWLDSFPHAWTVGVSRLYLDQRGVSLPMMMKYDLRWDGKKQRVCFPIRDMNGVLRGLQGRDVTGQSPDKYWHYVINGQARGADYWLGEHLLDFDKPVVTVEGGFDMTSVARVYPNVTAAMGAKHTLSSKTKLDRLASAFSIITLFDPNMAGEQARNKMHGWCYKKRLCKDAVFPGDKDPGELSPQEIRAALLPVIDESLLLP